MTVEKKDLDWGNLDFSYRKTDYSYVSNYKDGAWDEGVLTTDHSITLSECAGIFHYCQEVFEGLKAYTTADGSIVCFRPDMNAQRMADSAERLVMPAFPQDRFVEAVKQVVEANAAWVPPFGSGATLFVRPLMIATGGTLVVPKSHTDSILPPITRRSLVQVAPDLGIAVDERPVTWDEVASGAFVECGLCGTAAVISPVRETLTGIQGGQIEDAHGWVCKIC